MPRSQRGPIKMSTNQDAYITGVKTIHSFGQTEAFKNDVNDKSIKVSGGTQCITAPDDYAFPLNIKSGLPYMNIRQYTDDEWNILYSMYVITLIILDIFIYGNPDLI